MADVTKLVPHILKWEGGFVNDPDDLGGATNKGVTIKTYTFFRWRKHQSTPTIDDLKNISDEEFTAILKEMYRDACRADRIESQSVANAIVDWAWNSGTVTAAKELQKALGVTVDGVIGNVTLSAINSIDAETMFDLVQKTRIAYLERICVSRPANKKFMKGWMNRVNSLKFER
jgi:lysozyme family protein